MHTMTTAVTGPVMPTNGRGGSAAARAITSAAITAVSATSVTVTDLGANVAVGDILLLGTQGIWGVARSVNDTTEVVTVKRWHRIGGGVGVLPAVSGSLVAYPGGILRSARSTKLIGFSSIAAATTATIKDAAGNTVASPIARFNTPHTIRGPWTVELSAGTSVSLSFETFGDLDT